MSKEENILHSLNAQQIKAVTHIQGPLMVVAGAGSGKTKVLTHRIAYLLNQGITNPENILAVTFTNKAASEMKERVSHLLGRRSNLPFIGTFHAFCVSFLRNEIEKIGFPKSFTIADTGDTKAIMSQIFKEHGFDEKKLAIPAVRTMISNAKNSLYSPIDFAKQAKNDFEISASEIYKIYQDRLRKEGALDFDDLLFYTVKILLTEKETLEKYQDKFEFIMIDEYQDTNFVQYKLASLLSEKYRNIAIIGDDWQSIYSWRGADIKNILEFKKEYPDAITVNLEQNYRSTQNILKAANEVIKNNQNRLDKTLWTEKTDGEKIIYIQNYNERDEAESIIRTIKNLLGNHSTISGNPLTYNDFAILYRTNAQSRIIEEGMLRNAIPYKIIGGLKFYERKEIKEVISYMRIIQNPKDTTALLRIINVPARKIGAKTIEELEDLANKYECSPCELFLKDNIKEILPEGAIFNFSNIYRELVNESYQMPIDSLIKYIIRISGYKEFLENSGEEGMERLENIYELVGVAEKYGGLENPRMALQIFLEEVSLISDQDEIIEEENSVKLMTVHAAKGLEFSVVLIPGLEEGLFPHSRGLISKEDLEEERRLFYVALTRARERIFLFSTKQRFLYGEYENKIQSRFIAEIPEDTINSNVEISTQINSVSNMSTFFRNTPKTDTSKDVLFEIGDKVMHKSWGIGKIKNKAGSILEIIFENPQIGNKKLVAHIAPIEKI